MPFAYLPRSAILLGLRRPGFGQELTFAFIKYRSFERRVCARKQSRHRRKPKSAPPRSGRSLALSLKAELHWHTTSS